MRESDFLEVFNSGYQLLFDTSGKQVGVLVYLGDADALEEVEGRAEALLDAAGEQPGPSVDGVPEVRTIDAGLSEEEGKDGDNVGDSRGEYFGAHANNSAELDGGEAQGYHVIDGGFDVGEGSGDDGRVVGDEEKEVKADGVEVEHFLLELRTTIVGLLEDWARRG